MREEDREGEGEGERERESSISWCSPKMASIPGLIQAEARNQYSQWVSHASVRVPSTWTVFHSTFPGTVAGAGLEAVLDWKQTGCPLWDASVTSSSLICCATTPSPNKHF